MRQCAATRGCGVGGPFRSCPRSRAPRGGRGWIPAFAGKTVEPRRARASVYPEGGGGASGPPTRPRDGFLLSQERRWNHVVPAQAGTQRGEVERQGLSRVPGMDFCFRRKDGGTTSCPRKRVPRGERWSVGASHAPQPWTPAFAGKAVEPRRARASGYPEGGRWGGVSPAVPGMDSCFRRKDGGTTSCPRKRVPRGGRWSVGASHAFQGWISAFAGKTVEPRRARASGYPEGGGRASGPLTRSRDGFLLSQERRWNHVVPAQAGTQRGEVGRGLSRGPRDGFLHSQERRWNHVVPAQAGTQRGEVERRGLSRVPGMDSCFRRNGCGAPLSCPSRVGAVREPPLRKQGSTAHALRQAQDERNPTLSPARVCRNDGGGPSCRRLSAPAGRTRRRRSLQLRPGASGDRRR